MSLKKAIANGRKRGKFTPDSRGLMPLARARRVLTKNPIVRYREDLFEEQWAAMLSLKDAEEARKFLFALTWDGWTGPDGTAKLLVERYGAEPVLEHFVAGLGLGGMLYTPFHDALDVLAKDGSELAFEIALRACNPHASIMWKAKKQKIANVKPPTYPVKEKIDDVLKAIAKAHPEMARSVLDRRIALKDKRAKAVAQMLWPKPTKPKTPEKTILDALDAAARSSIADWPRFNTGIEDDPHTYEYFALRLVAVCSKTTGDWGVVFERISGSYDEFQPTCLQRFRYGSRIENAGWSSDHDAAVKLSVDGDTIKGPKGSLTLDAKKIAKRDLKPGLGCELEGDDGYNLRLRAYLDAHPGAFFGDVAELVRLSGVPSPLVICDTTSFAHAPGKRPSASPTYRSLANAIVARKPRLFVPGKSNLDFRLYATHRL